MSTLVTVNSGSPCFARVSCSSFSSSTALNVKSFHFSPFGWFRFSLPSTVLARTSVRL